ncbi:exosome complex component MTR3, animal type [Angomonas deanei]|uniref:3' exoribonuclease family, domain 1, putative n=1 Tax=Angomonas deanei TaxID=59799 RepID=A0A7G2C178_9TRYP|nr:exosome complex component MTR3, animal type [Angomonas deanei]CAD2213064.1 3' exoribonuclease family, domain 1, putative [Angomonas deanei]|eukprot:EPY39688.1 exosome complex component MTR3, animal type [Angomonas deanei]
MSHSEPKQLRKPHIAFNVVGNCLANTCVELGKTRVICVVRPPQQLVQEYRGDTGRISIQVHRAAASAAAATMIGSGDMVARNDRDFALALEGVAEKMVRVEKISQLLIEVLFEVVNDDGGLWDAATIALSTAFAAGGIEMYDLFAACSVGIDESGSFLVDLTTADEKRCSNVVTVCSTLTTGVLLYLEQQGTCELSTLQNMLQRATETVGARKAVIQEQLIEHVKQL